MRAAGVPRQPAPDQGCGPGIFLLTTLYPAVKETYEYINDFLREVDNGVSGKENTVEKSGEYGQDLSCYER